MLPGVLSRCLGVRADIAVLGSLHSLPAIQLLDVTDNNVSTLAQLASQSLISLTVDNNDLRGLYGVLGAPNLQVRARM